MTNPLFDLLDECILVARGDTVVEANATAARLLGGDPRGRRLLDLVPRPVAGAWMRATESTATLEVAGVESTDTATIVVLRDVSAAIVSRDEAARCSEAARLVADFSRRMSEPAPDGLDDLVDALLAELAAFLAVDRAAVVRHGDDGTFSVTHEWVRPGVASRRETEQNVPLDRAPWTTGVVLGRDWVHVADLAAPEELSFAGGAGFVERDLLLSHGLRSVVQIPLVVAGSVVGRLVLESRTAGIDWDESETIVVTSFASGLVATLGRVEAELGLQACAARASAVERAAGDVIVRLSAALREPLEQMVSAVARLDDLSELSTWTSEHTEALGRLDRSSVLVGEFLADVGDLADLEAGRSRLTLESVPLADAVREAVGASGARAAEAGVEMGVGLVDEMVTADREQLPRVLGHLLGQAVRHTTAGGLVEIGARRDAGVVTITVRQTGPGLPAGRLESMFDAFGGTRHGAEGAEPTDTLDVGLALCRAVVERSGGSIDIDRGPDGGTTVRVRLPASPNGDAAGVDDRRAGLPAGWPSVDRVLVVTGDDETARAVWRLLADIDHGPLQTVTGVAAALGALSLGLPDLIVIERRLPDGLGDDVIGVVRAHPRGRSTAILMLVSEPLTRAESRLSRVGATEALSVPTSVDNLRAAIGRVLGSRRGPDRDRGVAGDAAPDHRASMT